jgi:hypothetical protein
MFKKTPPPQTDMFLDLTAHLSDRKTTILDDPASWHNVFFREVTRRVDEAVFGPLFKEGGRPNAPLRVLLAMMVLKEGNGWSDEQLFDSCRFNIRCMRALGLYRIDDDVPVESTYYEFRRRLALHNAEHGGDLVGEAFRCAVRGQIRAHNIKGEKIRMDSKLIQSNIAKAGRLELVLETVRVSTAHMDLGPLSGVLDKTDIDLLGSLRSKTASNVAYPLDNGEKKGMLERLGRIIEQLLPYCGGDGTLARLYREQYQEVPGDGDAKGPGGPGEKIVPKKAKDVPSDSLQSVHDPEAAFRRKGHGKGEKQVSGYHANLTETFGGENPFELLTDVRTEAANVCEDAFLLPAIKGSDGVLDTGGEGRKTVVHVTTDGGYDGRANREAMAKQGAPHWNMAAHKGTPLRYALARDGDGNLTAYCKKTQADCKVSFSERAGKQVIDHGDGTVRYMTREDVESYLLLQGHLASQDPGDIDIRPNVESTVHQVFHRLLKRDKVKYRGKYKCNMYVFSRAYWTNFRRILKNEVETAILMLFSLLWPREDHQECPRTAFCTCSRTDKVTYRNRET